MTISERPDSIPEDFVKPSIIIRRQKSAVILDSLRLETKDPYYPLTKMIINTSDNILTINSHPDYFSFTDIADNLLNQCSTQGLPNPLPINLQSSENFTFQLKNGEGLIDLKSIGLTLAIEYENINVPVNILSYTQAGSGVLAWSVEGQANVDGKAIPIIIPIHKRPDGQYEVRDISFPGHPIPLLGIDLKIGS